MPSEDAVHVAASAAAERRGANQRIDAVAGIPRLLGVADPQ
jgi:hypothetical protein